MNPQLFMQPYYKDRPKKDRQLTRSGLDLEQNQCYP